MPVIGGALALVLLLAPALGRAGGVDPVPYAELQAELTRIVDFERLPRRAEPGFSLDMPFRVSGAWLGERFAGQRAGADAQGHDRPGGAPAPGALRVLPGAAGRNLSIAFHRGVGSNALYPLGPRGFPALDARGEGAVAIVFDDDQAALGLRVHNDYPYPLGQRTAGPGRIEIRFFARDGAELARIIQDAPSENAGFGYRRGGGLRDIAGILILNTDPGGIAVDDIIFASAALLG